MYVKRIFDQDIKELLQLAGEVFQDEIAHECTEEGIEAFQRFIAYENMMPKAQAREIVFFKVIEGEVLCGMSAIRSDGQICLLFVKKEWKKQGVARKLFYAMQQYCVIEKGLNQMTVNATANAVAVFEHLGFKVEQKEERQQNNLVWMTYSMNDARQISGQIVSKKKRKALNLFYIALLCLVIGFNLIAIKDLVQSFQLSEQQSNKVSQNTEEPAKNDTIQADDELHGIDSIECQIAEDLPYSIREEKYTVYEGKKSGKYMIEFDIAYPQIEGLSSELETEINKILKDCAMSTVTTLYLEPSEAMKEAMIKLENPVLMSGVRYKMTYASEEFISVVYEDQYIAGDAQIGYVDLRTRNINLKDGTVYEIKDMINLTDDFMLEWKSRMKKENPYTTIFDDIKTSEYRRILNGEIVDGRYHDAFFVDKNGIEIGITYHYSDENFRENGWTTAPFSLEEIKNYLVDETKSKVKIDE